MTNRREFLMQTPAALAQPAGRRPPNVILVMADQLRAGITREGGFPLDTMPEVDRLAREGVSFDCCYATSPLCSPTRTSLLTGRWPSAHRVRENPGLDHAFFEQDFRPPLHPLRAGA